MTYRRRFWLSYKSVRGKSYGTGLDKGEAVHVRGWDVGVEVVPRVLTTTPAGQPQDRDVLDVYTTRGSNGGMGRRVRIGRVATYMGEPRFFPADDNGQTSDSEE